MPSLPPSLRRWFRLPSPVDLGWSNSDALGLRQFTPYQEGKTWEDWVDHVRAHYPIRYVLLELLPMWVRRWVVWPLRRLRALVLDHALPRRRYHLLDLRGVDPLSVYRHGYLDPCEVFRLAGWACLLRWYRESGAEYDQRDLDPESTQFKQYDQAIELVHYWTITRVARDKQCDHLRAAVDRIPATPENRARHEAAKDHWLDHYRLSEELEEQMWLRLAALRPFLWD